MPNAKTRIKLTGDTHLPEVESDDFDRPEPHPEGAGTEGGGERMNREAPAAQGEGKTRESGERR